MRLLIEREQKDLKNMFGRHRGVEFTPWFRLELTPEEERLMEHYGLTDYVLVRHATEEREPWMTVAQARLGHRQILSSIDVAYDNEQVVRKGTQNFKTLLEIAKEFGGKEIVEL